MAGIIGGGLANSATVDANLTLDDFAAPNLDTLGATVSEAFHESLGPRMFRQTQAFAGRPDFATEDAFGRGADDQGPMMEPAEAQDRFGLPGLTFSGPITQGAAQALYDAKRAQAVRQSTIARGWQPGLMGEAGQMAYSFIGGMLDPINLAAGLVPGVGEARVLGMLGEGVAARVGARAIAGATAGAAGMTALEPLNYALDQAEGQDWTMAQALRNIAFGAVLGGGLHVIGGAIAGRGEVKAEPRETPRNPVTARIDALDPAAREATLRGAVAQHVEGEPVRVADAVEAMEIARYAERRRSALQDDTPSAPVSREAAVAQPEGSLPAVPDGHVRFFHGGNDYEGGPRWITEHRLEAQGYADKAASGDGRLHYVDVPTGELDRLGIAKAFDDTGTDSRSPYVSFDAPEHIASQMQKVPGLERAPSLSETLPASGVDGKVPDYVLDNRLEAVRIAERLGVAAPIRELAKEGWTAKQILEKLDHPSPAVDVDLIRSVRDAAGIAPATEDVVGILAGSGRLGEASTRGTPQQQMAEAIDRLRSRPEDPITFADDRAMRETAERAPQVAGGADKIATEAQKAADHPDLVKAFDDTGSDVPAPFVHFEASADLSSGLREFESRGVKAEPGETRRNPVTARIDALDPAARETVLRGAIAQHVEGEPVRVADAVEAADALKPPILAGEARTGEGAAFRVYHGTREGDVAVSGFDPAHLGKATGAPSAHEGFFFAASPETADVYARPNWHDNMRDANHTVSTLVERDLSMVALGSDEVRPSFEGAADVWKELRGAKLNSPEEVAHAASLLRKVEAMPEWQGEPAATRERFAEQVSYLEENARDMVGSRDAGGYIVPTTVYLKDPLVHDFGGAEYRDKSYADILREAKAAGHDGVVLQNTFDGGPRDHIVVAFSPDQIGVNRDIKRAADAMERLRSPPADPVIAADDRAMRETAERAPQVAGGADKIATEAQKAADAVMQRVQTEIAAGRLPETALNGINDAVKMAEGEAKAYEAAAACSAARGFF